jgi:hypothetical protein
MLTISNVHGIVTLKKNGVTIWEGSLSEFSLALAKASKISLT